MKAAALDIGGANIKGADSAGRAFRFLSLSGGVPTS